MEYHGNTSTIHIKTRALPDVVIANSMCFKPGLRQVICFLSVSGEASSKPIYLA